MFYTLKEKIKHGKYTNRLYATIRFGIFGGETKKINQQKRKDLQKNGVATIKLLQQILEQNTEMFFLDMGTLLGIVREGRILSHDLDIDVAVYITEEQEIQKIQQRLIDSGCEHKYSYVSDTLGIVEDSFTISGIKFDINYYRNEGAEDVCYLAYVASPEQDPTFGMSLVRLTCKAILKTEQMQFNGFPVNVPENAEEYLARRYGENWRVPDRGWVYWQGPSTQPIDDTCKQINI